MHRSAFAAPRVRLRRRLPVLMAACAYLLAAPAGAVGSVTTTLGPAAEHVRVAADRHLIAIVEPAGTTASLAVGVGRAYPQPAPAAGVLPAWAFPQVGSGADGHAVVIYPRCADPATVSTCDLYTYDPASKTATPVPGASHPGVGEVDGAIEGGAVAFNRWTSTALPGAAPMATERTRLYYRPVGGTTRRLSTKGGRRLALHRGLIAQLRDTRGEGYDIGSFTESVELVDLQGHRRTVRRAFTGEGGQTPTSPAFVGGKLVWGVAWNDRHGQVLRYDLVRRRLTEAWLPDDIASYAATSLNAGIAVRTTDELTSPPIYDLVRFSGLPAGTSTRG